MTDPTPRRDAATTAPPIHQPERDDRARTSPPREQDDRSADLARRALMERYEAQGR